MPAITRRSKRSSSEKPSLLNMPDESLHLIFSYFKFQDRGDIQRVLLLSVGSTCKRLRYMTVEYETKLWECISLCASKRKSLNSLITFLPKISSKLRTLVLTSIYVGVEHVPIILDICTNLIKFNLKSDIYNFCELEKVVKAAVKKKKRAPKTRNLKWISFELFRQDVRPHPTILYSIVTSLQQLNAEGVKLSLKYDICKACDEYADYEQTNSCSLCGAQFCGLCDDCVVFKLRKCQGCTTSICYSCDGVQNELSILNEHGEYDLDLLSETPSIHFNKLNCSTRTRCVDVNDRAQTWMCNPKCQQILQELCSKCGFYECDMCVDCTCGCRPSVSKCDFCGSSFCTDCDKRQDCSYCDLTSCLTCAIEREWYKHDVMTCMCSPSCYESYCHCCHEERGCKCENHLEPLPNGRLEDSVEER